MQRIQREETSEAVLARILRWSWTYYPDGSLKTITAPEGVYTYTYRLGGQVDKVTYPNNSTVQYAYDLQHRLTRIQNWAVPNTSLISRYDYIYDRDTRTNPDGSPYTVKGMIMAVEEQFRSHTDQAVYGPYLTSYDYDARYQLAQAAYPDYAGALQVPWDSQTHAWAYDAIGNRMAYEKKDNATLNVLDLATYTYNLANKGPQLQSASHTDGTPTTLFGYDENGNQTTQSIAGGVTTTYAWDQDDKMTGMTTTDASQSASYTYGYNGDRLRRTLDGVTWDYLYSNEDILKVSYPDTSDPPMYLTQGPGIDDVLAEFTNPAAPQYAYKNMLSSVMQLASAGNVVSNYTYSAWGELDLNRWPMPGSDNSPYGYTGREWDAPGLYAYRFRAYPSKLGRFTSADPLRKLRMQLYQQAANNPVVMVDPFGLYEVNVNVDLHIASLDQVVAGCDEGWSTRGCTRSSGRVDCECSCINGAYRATVTMTANVAIWIATDTEVPVAWLLSHEQRHLADLRGYLWNWFALRADAMERTSFPHESWCRAGCFLFQLQALAEIQGLELFSYFRNDFPYHRF